MEPGFYVPNKYGLRIENLYFSKLNKGSIVLENITMVPYETDLIEWSLLNNDEIEYLNQLHLIMNG